jgi:phosphoenolpyruvate synthase/pyruvate phosphate dikinase
VKRLILFAGLAVSLVVPTGAVALFTAAGTSPGARTGATSWEKLELYRMAEEAAQLDAQATAATTGTVSELRRIARNSRAWAERYETEPEWEEFAAATSAYAQLLADGLGEPGLVTREDYERVVSRFRAAVEGLPEKLPLS